MAAEKTKAPITEEKPPLPKRIQLDQDVTYWIKTENGTDFTRQFYANNIITDAQIIEEISGGEYGDFLFRAV